MVQVQVWSKMMTMVMRCLEDDDQGSNLEMKKEKKNKIHRDQGKGIDRILFLPIKTPP
jgi:hypothetical protein